MITPSTTETDTPRRVLSPQAQRKPSSFAGDVLKLVSGTTFAQALGILASPLLTRLYGPEAFGLLALFTSTTGTIEVVLCLRYELSIMLPETDEEAANLFAGSLVIAFLMSLLTVPIICLARPQIAQVLNAPELGPYLWLVPPVVLFGGVSLGHPALNYWATRRRRFARLSLTRVISSAFTVGAQLVAGCTGLATGGSLIGASVAGSIVSTFVLAVQTWRDDRRLLLRSTRWPGVLAWLRRHYKFPLYDTWSALMNTVSWQLPAFLLSAFFSPAVAGYYALGNRLLTLPMSLIGGAIGQIFFQRAAEAKTEGRLSAVVEAAFQRLVALGMFPFLLLTVMGRDLFVVFFGQRWAEAGVYTQILSIWSFVWFVSSPLSALFDVLEKQEFGLAWNGANLATRFLSLWIGGQFHNGRLALLLFAVSGVFVYGYLNVAIMAASGVGWRKTARTVLSAFAVSVPAALLILALKIVEASIWIRTVASCALLAAHLLRLAKSDLQWRVLFRRIDRTEKPIAANENGD